MQKSNNILQKSNNICNPVFIKYKMNLLVVNAMNWIKPVIGEK
jgi:hypothetical protein